VTAYGQVQWRAWCLPLGTSARHRTFLRPAVDYLKDRGIKDCGTDQFLDIGLGIPTIGDVHEVAQRINPAARLVYY